MIRRLSKLRGALAGEILAKLPPGDEPRIRWAWRQVLGREAKPDEVRVLNELVQKHRLKFAADARSVTPQAVDAAELAAWTSLSRVLLNLTETITRN